MGQTALIVSRVHGLFCILAEAGSKYPWDLFVKLFSFSTVTTQPDLGACLVSVSDGSTSVPYACTPNSTEPIYINFLPSELMADWFGAFMGPSPEPSKPAYVTEYAVGIVKSEVVANVYRATSCQYWAHLIFFHVFVSVSSCCFLLQILAFPCHLLDIPVYPLGHHLLLTFQVQWWTARLWQAISVTTHFYMPTGMLMGCLHTKPFPRVGVSYCKCETNRYVRTYCTLKAISPNFFYIIKNMHKFLCNSLKILGTITAFYLLQNI